MSLDSENVKHNPCRHDEKMQQKGLVLDSALLSVTILGSTPLEPQQTSAAQAVQQRKPILSLILTFFLCILTGFL